MFSDTNKIAFFCWNRTFWDENNFFIILINEIRNIAEAAHFWQSLLISPSVSEQFDPIINYLQLKLNIVEEKYFPRYINPVFVWVNCKYFPRWFNPVFVWGNCKYFPRWINPVFVWVNCTDFGETNQGIFGKKRALANLQ